MVKIYENCEHSSFNIGNNKLNFNEKTRIWEITLESKTEPRTVTKLKYNPIRNSLNYDTIDASNADMVDAYVKGIIQLSKSQGINKESVFIDTTLYSNKKLAIAIKSSARRLGIATSPPTQIKRRTFN